MRSDEVTVQYNTVQYITVHYSTVQYSTVQYSTVLQVARVELPVPDTGLCHVIALNLPRCC